MKHLYTFLVGFFLLTTPLFSQTPGIQIAKFDANLNYVAGESISVILDTPGIFPIGHVFTMELSDATGSFATPVLLATENEFFLPVMNGVIPAGTSAGTGYKIRITSNLDADGDGVLDLVPVETNAFSISAPGATSLGFDIIFPNPPPNFIDCIAEGRFGFLDKSSGNTTTNIGGQINNSVLSYGDFTINLYPYNIVNEAMNIGGGVSIVPAVIGSSIIFSLPNGLPTNFYVLEIISQDNGLSASKSYIYHFNTGNTGIANLSSEEECVGNVVDFQISTGSMDKNYPGSKYTLDFGDGTTSLVLTHAQIFAPQVDGVSGNKWSHTYNDTTCDSPNQILDNSNNKYYFQVQFKLSNKGIVSCNTYDENGNGTAKWVNISLPPTPDFTVDNAVCIQNDLVAIDNTTVGAYGFSQSCLTDYEIEWKLDPPNSIEFSVSTYFPTWIDPNTGDLTIPSTNFLMVEGPGCYVITLIVNNPEGCTEPQQISKTVAVQATPSPSFTYSPQTIVCPGETISFSGNASLSGLPCQQFSQNWTVVPVPGSGATSSGFNFEIDPSQPLGTLPENYENPDITFTQEGQYEVTLTITNACGDSTYTETITISGDPTVDFDPDVLTLCEDIDNQGFTIDFSDPSFSPNYSTGALAPTTFNWTVSGVGVTGSDYSFINGTNASSQYPIIQFNNYKTYIITVTVDGNCSQSNQAIFTFEYKRAPKITNTVFSQAICSGQTTTAVSLLSDLTATTFQWTINAPPGITGHELIPTLGTSIPPMTLTNATNQPLDLVITVTPEKDGCPGIAKDFVFTVNPAPVIPDQSIVICSEETFLISPIDNQPPATPQTTIVPIATVYTWTVIDNPNISGESDQAVPQNNISQQLANNSNIPQTVVYTVTPTSGANGNCVGEDFLVTVQVDPIPTIPNQNIEICSGESFVVTLVNNPPALIVPNSTTYIWTVVDNPNVTGDLDEAIPQTQISQQLTNNSNTPETVIYTVTSVAGTCVGQDFTVEVTVNPTPVIPNQNEVICSGEFFNMGISNNPPVTITPANTTYTWTVVDNPNVTGETDEPNPQSFISQQLTNHTNIPQDVLYTVTPVSGVAGNCPGMDFSLTVTVNPTPVIPNKVIDVCSGEAFTVSLSNNPPAAIVPANTTYTWMVVDNPNVFGDLPKNTPQPQFSQTLAISGSIPEILVYTVTPTGPDGCVGEDFTITVTVNPAPMVPDSNETICSGETFAVTPVNNGTTTIVFSGTTYVWTVVDNPNIIGDTDEAVPQSNISQQLTNISNTSQTVVYTVTPNSGAIGNCSGASFTITVQINPMPDIQDQTVEICSGQTFGVIPTNNPPASIVPNSTTYTWSVTDNPDVTGEGDMLVPKTQISQTLTNNSNVPQIVLYTVVPTSGGCVGNSFEVVVTVNPTPVMDPIPTQTICSGTAFSDVVPTSNVSGTTYSWVLQNTGIPGTITGYPTNGTGNLNGTTILNNGSSPYVLNYELTPTFGSCDGATEVFQLIVNPAPSVQFDIPDQDICSGSASLLVNISSPTSGANISWQINSVPLGLTGVSSTNGTNQVPSFTLINTTANPISLVIEASAETAGVAICSGPVNTYTITVYPEIVVTSQPISTQIICEGGTINTLSLTYSGGTGNPSYQWFENTTNSNSGGTPISGANSANYDPPPFASTGTFYFYVEISLDGAGCGSVTSDVAVVEVLPDPVIDTQPLAQQTQCVGSTADQLQVSVSGGLGTLSYQWYSNTVNSNIGGVPIPGETNPSFVPPTNIVDTFYYYLIATQNVSGCEVVSTVAEVEVVPTPSFDQHPLGSAVCLNGDAPDLNFSYTDGTGSVNYQWYNNTTNSTIGGAAIPGANSQTYDPPTGTLGSMFYYVEITFADTGCGAIISNPAEVIVIPAGEIDPINDIVVCNLEVVPTIVFTTPDISGNTSYQWVNSNPAIGLAASGVGDLPSFTAQNTSVNPVSAIITVTSIYSLGGTDCQGASTSFTITVGGEIQVSVSMSDYNGYGVTCFNSQDGSIDISAQGGAPFPSAPFYQYNWTGPNGFTSTSKFIDKLEAGSYVLTITDAAGCSYDFTYELTAPDEIIINNDAVQNVLCNGEFNGNILVTPSGGTGSFSYVWMKNGSPAAITQDFQNIGPGLYTLIVTDANGCTQTKDYVISEPAPIQINVENQPSVRCFGDTNTGSIDIEVSGGTPLETAPGVFEYTYNWTGPNGFSGTSQDIGNVPAGIYTVTVFDNLGCEASLDIEITEPDPLVINFDVTNESCMGVNDGSISVQVQGGMPPYSYLWGNGATTSTISNLAPGIYNLLVTDANDCEENIQIPVEEAPEMQIEAIADNISCNGFDDGKISVTVTGGNPVSETPLVYDYDYYWQGPGNFTSIQATIENLVAGIYTLRVSDALGCEATKTYTITEPPVLEASYEASQVFCFGVNDGSIDLTITGGAPPYTFSWNNGETTENIENLSPGNYEVTITDAGGCSIELSIEIKPDYILTVPPPIGASIQEFCLENQPVLADVQVDGLEIIWYADPNYLEELSPDHLLKNGEVVYAQNFDSSTGCYSEELLKVEIIVHDTNMKVYNLITVDGNDMNSRLKVEGIERFPKNTMSIFNRYGKLVWKINDYNNTDRVFRGMANQGGLMVNKEEFLPTGTYFYVLEYPNPCMQTSLDGYLQIDNKN